MRIYRFINLNISHYIIFLEIWVTRLFCCQWCISLCLVWEPREGSRAADCLPTAAFPTASSSPCFRQLSTALDLPRKPAYLFFTDFGCYRSHFILISFLDGENQLSCLSGWGSGLHACWSSTWCQPMYWELHGRNKFPSSLAMLAVQVLVCHKNEELSSSSSKNPSCSLLCAAAHAGLVLNHAGKWV